ncbi:hypothetical protein MACK_002571 [Theileria orientalis]|uniref:Uncharacterized protein n=1 Tax=Theileria orientalis TaxID=68886 RepID=A0A976QVL7_THEOR|nr:hypothetical protein MACK_002571 [Theileria orientalis]
MLNLFLLISLLIANNSVCVKYVTLDVCASNNQHFLTESSMVVGRPCKYYIPRGGIFAKGVTYGNQLIWEPTYDGEVMGYVRYSEGDNPVILVSSSFGVRKILKYYNLLDELWIMFKEFDSHKNKKLRESRLIEKTDSENAGELSENSAQGTESGEDSTTPEEAKMDITSMFSLVKEGENAQAEGPNPDDMEIEQNKSNIGKSYGLLRRLTTRIDLREVVKQNMDDKSECSETEESLTFRNNELIFALEDLMETEGRMCEGAVGGEGDDYQEKKALCTSRWDIKGVKELDHIKVLEDLDVLQTFQVLIKEENGRGEKSLSSIQEEDEQDLIDYEKDLPNDLEESVLVNGVFLKVCHCDKCKKKGHKELHFVGHSDNDPPDVQKIEPSLELVEVSEPYPSPQEAEEKSLQVPINPDQFPAISEILNSMTIDDAGPEDVDSEVQKGQNSEVFQDIFGANFDPSKFEAASDYQETEMSISDSDDSDEEECELVEEQINILIDQLYPNLKYILAKTRTSTSQSTHQADVEGATNNDMSLTAMALSSDDDSDFQDEDKESQDPIPMPTDIELGQKQDLQDPYFVDSNDENGNLSEASNQPPVPFPRVIILNGPTRPVPRPRSFPSAAKKTKFKQSDPDSETNVKGSKSTEEIVTKGNDEKPSEVTQTEEDAQSQTQPDDSSVGVENRALKLFTEDSEDEIDMSNPPKTLLGQFLLERTPDNHPSKKDLESPDTQSHHTLSDYAILKSQESKTKGLKNLKRVFTNFFKKLSKTGTKSKSDKSKKSSSKSTSSSDSKPQEADKEVSDGDKKDPENATSETNKPSDPPVPTPRDLGARPKHPPPKPPRSRLSQIILEENITIQVGQKENVEHKDPEPTEDHKKHRKRKSTREEKQLERMETKIKKHHLIFLRHKYKEEKEKTRQKTLQIKLLRMELDALKNELMERRRLAEENLAGATQSDESYKQVLDKVDEEINQEETTETAERKEETKDNDEQKTVKDSCKSVYCPTGPSVKKRDDDDDKIEEITEKFSRVYLSRKKNKSCSVS